jgi:hypothetical protein
MMTRTLLAATILAASHIAMAGPTWRAFDHGVAMTAFEHGIAVGVVFSSEENCDVARLAIHGNTDITAMHLSVDGENLGMAETVSISETAYVLLLDDGLRALRNGRRAILTTDQGRLSLDLTGSSAAIVGAYESCMADVRREQQTSPAYRVLMPTSREVSF